MPYDDPEESNKSSREKSENQAIEFVSDFVSIALMRGVLIMFILARVMHLVRVADNELERRRRVSRLHTPTPHVGPTADRNEKETGPPVVNRTEERRYT
jgi:hypothetical protein